MYWILWLIGDFHVHRHARQLETDAQSLESSFRCAKARTRQGLTRRHFFVACWRRLKSDNQKWQSKDSEKEKKSTVHMHADKERWEERERERQTEISPLCRVSTKEFTVSKCPPRGLHNQLIPSSHRLSRSQLNILSSRTWMTVGVECFPLILHMVRSAKGGAPEQGPRMKQVSGKLIWKPARWWSNRYSPSWHHEEILCKEKQLVSHSKHFWGPYTIFWGVQFVGLDSR